MIIITNNPMVKEKMSELAVFCYLEGDYGDVLAKVKQQIIEKHVRLLSHPNWSLAVLNDFAFVDFYIAQSTLDRMGVAR